MKRFKFTLEVVLKERKRVEDLKLREWTLSLQLLQKMIDEQNALTKRLQEVVKEGDKLAGFPENTIGALQGVESFLKGQRLKIDWKKRDIERANMLTNKKKEEYVKARQKREVLEKLKEKKLAQHRKILKKKELKELDEIYVTARKNDITSEDAA